MLKNEPFFLIADPNTDRACLLLHGLGGGVYEMQLLGEFLHQRGLTTQGINYPGHDRPSGRMPNTTWQQWYDHSLTTYEKLAQQYTSISVVGFSTGCPLALHLAASHPVERLVLLSPFLAIRHNWYYLLRPEVYLDSIGQLLEDVPRFKLPIREPAMRRQAESVAFFQTFNLPAVRSALELISLVKTELPSITVPTLIIQSPQDNVVDPPGAELVYQTIGARTKKLHWLKQSDHVVGLDLEREEVFAEVGAFLLPS